MKEAIIEGDLKQSKQSILDIELAISINNKLPFVLNREFVIKPLQPTSIEIEREFPIPSDEKDPETGATLYSKTEMRKEIIECPIREGIIISIPTDIATHGNIYYEIGQHILYQTKHSSPFHLFKDSVLLGGYNIIGKVKPSHIQAIDILDGDKENDISIEEIENVFSVTNESIAHQVV